MLPNLSKNVIHLFFINVILLNINTQKRIHIMKDGMIVQMRHGCVIIIHLLIKLVNYINIILKFKVI